MASIAKLVVSLGANIANFTTDMARADRISKSTFKKIERAAEDAGKKMAIAVTAATAATVALIAKTATAADQIRDLSIVTGISTEALSAYKFAAEQSGVSFDALTNGVNKMQRAIVEAQSGTSETSRAFERLGISIETLLKLSPDKQFELVAESIGKLESETLKSATAQQIFGRAGAQLLPILKSGEQGIAAATEKVIKYGAAVGQGFADDADQFLDNMGEIKLIGQGVANSFVASLLPSLISVQEQFIQSGDAMRVAQVAGTAFGSVAKTLASSLAFLAQHSSAAVVALSGFAGLKILTPLLFGLGGAATIAATALGGLIGAFLLFRARAAEVEQSIQSMTYTVSLLTNEYIAAASATELLSQQARLRQQWLETEEQLIRVQERLAKLREDVPDDLEQYHAEIKKLADEEERLKQVQGDGVERLGKIAKQLKALKSGGLDPVIVSATKLPNVFEKGTNAVVEMGEAAEDLSDDAFVELLEIVNELEQEQASFNDELQRLRDIGDPVAAMVRGFERDLSLLNRALAEGAIDAEEYRRVLNALSDSLGESAAQTVEAAEKMDVWAKAGDEAIRILQRSFTSAWESIVDGSQSAFDGILDGFKTLLAEMLHDLMTAPLLEELRKLFNGKGGFNLGNVIGGLSGIAGVALGSLLGGGGQGAGIGSALGAIAGKALGQALGGSLGSFAGPIGTVLGSVLGGVLGGLFDKDRPPVLDVSGFSRAGESGSDLDRVFSSAFGSIFTRSRRIDEADIAKFGDAIVEFDNQIAGFLGSDQIGKITDALADWRLQLEGEAITLEAFLKQRFGVILGTFSQDVQAFVKLADDLETQANRLAVAVKAQDLLSASPELFGGRSLSEFLAVVDAFADGITTITDAFNQIVAAITVIEAARSTLREFADSDVVGDYERLVRLQNETPIDTLARLGEEFFDAIAAFDGSPEQLIAIADRVQSIRQAEIAALQHIDAIQKGLSANLEKLRADVLDIIAGPKSEKDIFIEAAGLVDLVKTAQTPEEIAKLGAQFEGLIRQLTPETVARLGDDLVRLIDQFRAAAGQSFDRVRDLAVDTAASLRAMADAFLTSIPDALALIASTNDRAAAALEAIAPVSPADASITIEGALAEQNQILLDGTNMMASALRSGAADMQRNIAAAIQSGFGNARVTVHVHVADSGLVTQ